MSVNKILDIFGGLLTIGLVTAVLLRGSEAARVLTAIGSAFSGALHVAITG